MKSSQDSKARAVSEREGLAKKLIDACLAGDRAKVRTLLQRGADPNAFVERWALRALPTAVRKGNTSVVKLLLEAGADPNGEDTGGAQPPGGTALENACATGQLKIVSLLIDQGADVNQRGYWLPLKTAISRGHLEIVRLLLRRGATLDSDFLFYASRSKNAEQMLRCLIAAGADVNYSVRGDVTIISNGLTPLHQVVRHDPIACVELLLQAGAKVNAQTDYNKETPLMKAAEAGNFDSVRILVAAGADMSIGDRAGKTAEKIARRFGRKEISAFLREQTKGLQSKHRAAKPSPMAVEKSPQKSRSVTNKRKPSQKKIFIARSKGAKKLATVGASDFVDMVHESGHPEWVVLAVEAPLAKVVKQYCRSFQVAECVESPPIKPAADSDKGMAEGIPLVEPGRSSWTVILRTMCYPIGTRDIAEALEDAETLSKNLGARALSFVGEDTSGAMQCDLFENGKKLGTECWENQGSDADSLFKKLGLYIPACYAQRNKNSAWLAVWPSSQGKIGSAALVLIRH